MAGVRRYGAKASDKLIALRPLVREELSRLEEARNPEGTGQMSGVMKLRDSHHMVARLAAAGKKGAEIAALTGYSYNRISILLGSPAMQDLVAKYRLEIDARFFGNMDAFIELATRNMIAAERMVADRLDEADDPEAEAIPIRTLLAISRDGADRLGYGKKQTNVNVNVDFAAQLERAIKRSGVTVVSSEPSPGARAQASIPTSRSHEPPAVEAEILPPVQPLRRRA